MLTYELMRRSTRRFLYQSSKTPIVVCIFGLLSGCVLLIVAVKPHSIYFSVLNRWNLFNQVALVMLLRYEYAYFMRLYAEEL